MSRTLRLRFERHADNTGQLFVAVQSGEFCGASSAWFNERQLSAFANKLITTYPLQNDAPLLLEGGYWDNSASYVDQVHLSIKVYPIGSTGRIGCRVVLNTPLEEHERPDSQAIVAVELQTTYERLSEFGQSIELLAKGNAPEACLETA